MEKEEATEVVRIANVLDEKKINVDSKLYTVKETENAFIISFDEDYINNLESKEFCVYCLENSYAYPDLIKGEKADVNCDGKINITDAKETLRASLGMTDDEYNVYQIQEMQILGDMDNDGKITVKDVS